MDKVEIHKAICDKLNATYKAKNADYGDSFARVRREEGVESILVRLKDKLYRLETLLHGSDRQVSDESIEDSFVDMANYCLMELVEREVDRSKEQKFIPSSFAKGYEDYLRKCDILKKEKEKKKSEIAKHELTRKIACERCFGKDKCRDNCSYEECKHYLLIQDLVMDFVRDIKAGGGHE